MPQCHRGPLRRHRGLWPPHPSRRLRRPWPSKGASLRTQEPSQGACQARARRGGGGTTPLKRILVIRRSRSNRHPFLPRMPGSIFEPQGTKFPCRGSVPGCPVPSGGSQGPCLGAQVRRQGAPGPCLVARRPRLSAQRTHMGANARSWVPRARASVPRARAWVPKARWPSSVAAPPWPKAAPPWPVAAPPLPVAVAHARVPKARGRVPLARAAVPGQAGPGGGEEALPP